MPTVLKRLAKKKKKQKGTPAPKQAAPARRAPTRKTVRNSAGVIRRPDKSVDKEKEKQKEKARKAKEAKKQAQERAEEDRKLVQKLVEENRDLKHEVDRCRISKMPKKKNSRTRPRRRSLLQNTLNTPRFKGATKALKDLVKTLTPEERATTPPITPPGSPRFRALRF